MIKSELQTDSLVYLMRLNWLSIFPFWRVHFLIEIELMPFKLFFPVKEKKIWTLPLVLNAHIIKIFNDIVSLGTVLIYATYCGQIWVKKNMEEEKLLTHCR